MNVKTMLYIALAIIGFLIPNYFVLMHGLESGNWLFWMDVAATFQLGFANKVASAFLSDLMLAVVVFFVWMIPDAREKGVARPWLYCILTMAFGLAFSMPLYLAVREARLNRPGSGA